MPMPFSPCPAGVNPCPDVTIGILTKVFGPIITSLVNGTDPNAAPTTMHVLASTIGFFNSGLLVVASLIITYVAVMGAINTANDGEAMGRSWSAFATPLRIVAGGAVLLPSASGYSFIQMLVLMISLWSVGFANGIYKVGMGVGLMKPDGIVSSTYSAGSYYGMRQFAKDYLATAYCAKTANTVYQDSIGNPEVETAAPDKVLVVNGKTVEHYYFKDRNPVTNLAGGDPVCGTIVMTKYVANTSIVGDASGTHQALDAMRVALMTAKWNATINLKVAIEQWVALWPNTLDDPAWNAVQSKKFNELVATAENQVGAQIAAQMTGANPAVTAGVQSFLDTLTIEGWGMMGGYYQRVALMRSRLANITSEPVATSTPPAMSGLPDDDRADVLRGSVEAVTEAIIKKSENLGNGYTPAATIKPEDIASFIPKNTNSEFSVGAISEDAGGKLALMVNQAMQQITNTAIGSGSGVDAVTRMKLTGDKIAEFRMDLWQAKAAVLTAIAAARVAAGILNSAKVLGSGVDPTGIVTPLWDWFMAVPNQILTDMAEYASILAFYFGVLLPSLPYTIFMITVVGWILAVFQSVIAAPLWAIMHMRPSQTFVGSDTQGYPLLLALFVRPSLAVVGLFAAMLIADPVVDYIAKAFFAMRGDVVVSTGLLGSAAAFYSFFWWCSVFGLLLLPVLYMIYGLPQVLPDAVLKWLGSGLDDMGAAFGTSHQQGNIAGTASRGAAIAAGSSGQGMLKSQTGALKEYKRDRATEDRDRASASRNAPVNANHQGVTGQSAYGPSQVSYSNNLGKGATATATPGASATPGATTPPTGNAAPSKPAGGDKAMAALPPPKPA